MPFELPDLYINPPFTWGPPAEELTIDGQPFQLYFKTNPLPIVDWFEDERTKETTAKGQFITVQDEARANALKNERSKKSTKFTQRRPNRFPNNPRVQYRKPKRQLAALPTTANITPETVIHAMFSQLELFKLRVERAPSVVDLGLHGLPPVYNAAMDKASCGTPVLLDEAALNPEFYSRPGVMKDPVFLDLIKANLGEVPIVVTTDEVLSALMTCARSMNPWHVSVERYENIIFLSKSDDCGITQQWVSETAPPDTKPTENDAVESERISSLGKESTQVHEAFIRACCTRSRPQMKNKRNPFPNTQPRMYRYRQYTMHPDTPDTYKFFVRCDIDAVQNDDYVRMFGLLEQRLADKPSEWRKHLDERAAAFIPLELRLNSCKMARWMCMSILSGVQRMKMGFIARAEKAKMKFGDPNIHQVLTVQTNNPFSLAVELGVNVNNMWAVADTLLQPFIKNRELTEALLVKASGDRNIMLTDVPEASDYESNEEESSDEV